MSLKKRYPKLMAKLNEPVYEIRDLVVADENYNDVDSDEFDIFEPDEYNFIVYVTERVQQAIGSEQMNRLIKKLEAHAAFENFFAPEADMYGIRADLDEEGVADTIVRLIEEELCE